MTTCLAWQEGLLLVLVAATLTMVVGVAIVLMFLPAPEPLEEDYFELTSGPSWYNDLKAKDLNQASSLCPPPTPGSKPSDS